MNFYLVCPELEFTLELPFSPLGREQVVRQVRRMQEEEGQARSFEYRLAEELSKLIPQLTDWDIKPPTGAQMAYATSLCAQLGIPLPAATRRSRAMMQTFLAEAKSLAGERSQ
ncbi:MULTISPECIES: hypothetical protein [Stenotrophomonas]|uniref:hypothetical protein n=1 Tax=Stenotrophomonas TaxID=40323 RepID=UPI000FE1F17F|nr:MULTISPECIES: hypothetical protein [Stenotrophomonas]